MAILKVRDEQGNVIEIPCIKGEKGERGEKGDSASATDVQINGTSITVDGVANIPIASKNEHGLTKMNDNFGFRNNANGEIYVFSDPTHIEKRKGYHPLVISQIDLATKAAMCDGKGAEWTQDEKAMARERIGIDREPVVIDVEPNEDVRIIDILEYDGKPLSEYGFTQMWIYAESVEGLTAISNELQIRINNRNITDAIPNLCAPNNFLYNTTTQYWGGYLNTRNGIALSRQTATTYKHWRSNVQIQANMYDLLFQKSINEVYLAGISADIPKGTKFKVILK